MEYSLYFHVPFCLKKCDYCHFYVVPSSKFFHDLYMKALKTEWEMRSDLLCDKKLVSIYFGGGTPTLLGRENIDEILSWIRPSEDVEITIESNPETPLDISSVNRVSVGVQSLDRELLCKLSRRHTPEDIFRHIEKVVCLGIKNISIDLMYDIPGQTLRKWEDTLLVSTSLPVTHISLYNLTIEEHTSFYKRRTLISKEMADDVESLKMLKMALDMLDATGFKRYEISAFAKPGFASLHNSGYWTGRSFLGLGPSAFSYWDGARFKNCSNIQRYAKQLKEKVLPIDFYEKLSSDERERELLAINLRLLDGIEGWPDNLDRLRFELFNDGFLDPTTNKLSDKGLLFYDSVAERIVNF